MNSETVALSNGLLPPLSAIKALSVGGAHTNSFLRACRASCKTPIETLQDNGGRLDVARLSAQDANFADAVQDGLMWTMIDGLVASTWPAIVDLAQQALNAKAAQEPSSCKHSSIGTVTCNHPSNPCGHARYSARPRATIFLLSSNLSSSRVVARGGHYRDFAYARSRAVVVVPRFSVPSPCGYARSAV